jgi:hypothetical protein
MYYIIIYYKFFRCNVLHGITNLNLFFSNKHAINIVLPSSISLDLIYFLLSFAKILISEKRVLVIIFWILFIIPPCDITNTHLLFNFLIDLKIYSNYS